MRCGCPRRQSQTIFGSDQIHLSLSLVSFSHLLPSFQSSTDCVPAAQPARESVPGLQPPRHHPPYTTAACLLAINVVLGARRSLRCGGCNESTRLTGTGGGKPDRDIVVGGRKQRKVWRRGSSPLINTAGCPLARDSWNLEPTYQGAEEFQLH